MTEQCLPQTMLAEFVQESLTLLDDAMEQVNDQGCAAAGVNTIFRCLHTLKGTSGMLDLVSLSRFIHRFEDFLRDRQGKELGLTSKEGRVVMTGLNLLQEAVQQVHNPGLLETPPYREFFPVLEHLLTEKISLARVETLLHSLKELLGDKAYGYDSLLLAPAIEALDKCCAKARTGHQKTVFTFALETLERVVLNGQDITALVARQMSGLEEVAREGKHGLARLNMPVLQHDIVVLRPLLRNGTELIDWDMIEDLCAISPEVIQEAFNRFWVEGIAREAEITVKKGGAETVGETGTVVPTTKKPDGDENGEREEYLRVSGSVLQDFSGKVGDLVANRNGLENLIQEMSGFLPLRYQRHLQDTFGDLDRHVNLLERQVGVLNNRRLRDVFQRFPALVTQLAATLDKDVALEISGGEIEVSRHLVKILHDPLLHLIRNSVDHGLESVSERLAAGKPGRGSLRITAERDNDWLRLVISDDGRGLDPEKIRGKAMQKNMISPGQTLDDAALFNLIFLPGFSTVEQVSAVSGRGVGMDVVRTGIEAGGGDIRLTSETGCGVTIEISMPLGAACRTRSVLLVEAAGQAYGVEYACLVEVLAAAKIEIHSFRDRSFFYYRHLLIPYLSLASMLSDGYHQSSGAAGHDFSEIKRLMVVEDEQGRRVAFGINGVKHKIKVVVTPFRHLFLTNNPLFSGTAVVGTGEPCLILNFRDLASLTDCSQLSPK